MTVYRLKAVEGHGWVEGIDDRGPLVTAIPAEARTWDDIDQARKALDRVNRTSRVQYRIVAEAA